MKDIYRAFAVYNSEVNRDIINLLKTADKRDVVKRFKTYFPSIYENLLHLLATDINWFKRFRDVFGESAVYRQNSCLSGDFNALIKEFEHDLTALFACRLEVDRSIMDFIGERSETDFSSVIRYKNYRNENVEKELWKILLQWFNHQTHHRGQVSVLLDMIGIENDYSSLLTRI